MQSREIRQRFLDFFRKKGHAIIPSASLVTSDEKGVTNPTLFNTAGMQPLIPFLLGKPHPEGKRLANSQKCLRTVDIDDVGDKTHATFFEMLGNWSLGDYFKREAIEWSFEFLTDKDKGLGLDPKRLYVTVFEGDDSASKDNEAADIWKEIFKRNNIEGERIYYMSAKSNWWEAGDNGPCGPDSEMFYDITNKFNGRGLTREEYISADEAREVVEVWNDVFMQYEKKDGKIVGNLPKPSIDTGAGLERLAMTLQGVDNIYDTDLFKPIMNKIDSCSEGGFLREKRIIADHVRSSSFLIADGVIPSNTDRGYILRRLLRRAIRYSEVIKLSIPVSDLVLSVNEVFKGTHVDISKSIGQIKKEIDEEAEKFKKSLSLGMKEFSKIGGDVISGVDAFKLFSSYGLPIDTTIDLAREKNISVDISGYNEEFRKHQEMSRLGAEQKFKGGLADSTDPMVVRYHTATHLLHQALFDVLGEGVMQKGSNITAERLRFDFSHGSKMSDEEKKRVEDIINEKIQSKIPVQKVIMSKDEAMKTGARHLFTQKYGDQISIYFIGNNLDTAYSKEFCGGPHVANTSELSGPEHQWKFKIQKEEAVSEGVRRIKAVLK